MKFSEIKENSNIVLNVFSGDKHLDIKGTLDSFINESSAIISINDYSDKILNFKNVNISLFYNTEEGVPYSFVNAKVFFVKDKYILQVSSMGIKTNRRSSFRVSVGVSGWLTCIGKGNKQVIVKDVSLSGFAITDRTNDFKLSKGDRVSLKFDDINYEIRLEGICVRIEERENCIIYGFSITNLCKDLSTYVNLKQRKNRNSQIKRK